MHTIVTPRPRGSIAGQATALSVRRPAVAELAIPAEVECPNWLEQPVVSSDLDAVHWLELGHPSG